MEDSLVIGAMPAPMLLPMYVRYLVALIGPVLRFIDTLYYVIKSIKDVASGVLEYRLPWFLMVSR